jgi:hypothetical protein
MGGSDGELVRAKEGEGERQRETQVLNIRSAHNYITVINHVLFDFSRTRNICWVRITATKHYLSSKQTLPFRRGRIWSRLELVWYLCWDSWNSADRFV